MNKNNKIEKKDEKIPNPVVSAMLTPGGGKAFADPNTYLNFLHKPHTILALVILGIFGIYFAVFQENIDLFSNYRHAVLGVVVVFLAFSVLHFHNHSFIKRPHPLFWRFVRGTAVLFLLFKVFLLFLTRDQARQVYHFIDPQLGVPLETERDYAVDCRIYTPENPDSKFANVKGTIDIFVFAHSECWWDHLLLDVLGCNLLGMLLGYALLKIFHLKFYTWNWKSGSKSKKTENEVDQKEERNNAKKNQKKNNQRNKKRNYKNKKSQQNNKQKKQKNMNILKRIPKPSEGFGNLFTGDKTNYRWHLFDSPKKFLAWCLLICIMLIIELNSFFLKRPLWVPSNHPLTILRMVGWGFWGVVAARDYFEYFTNPNCKKMGPDAWICLGIATVESLLAYKFGEVNQNKRLFQSKGNNISSNGNFKILLNN
ncbi:phosphatidylserine synthase 2 [Anaeramoeba flamelloides]|uniref:Phosphatidylserine synthase 2 n=1 Tax=Anaeramoeba flamelloides TaxID=1746091 RepID=A0ABQ8XL62_9EUKA|nr:phosphatidylserine synthase 2 [Anaeramoeba flamelloides]